MKKCGTAAGVKLNTTIDRTRIKRITRIGTDKIRGNQCHPRHQCSIRILSQVGILIIYHTAQLQFSQGYLLYPLVKLQIHNTSRPFLYLKAEK